MMFRRLALLPLLLMTVLPVSLYAQTILNVKAFGAVGDGNADDQPAIQAAIDKAKQTGPGTVVLIPEGRYRLSQTSKRLYPYWTADIEVDDGARVPTERYGGHLVIDNTQGITLRGQGNVELLGSDWSDPVLTVLRSDDIALESLTLGCDPIPFAQAQVLQVDAKANTITVEQRPGGSPIGLVAQIAKKEKRRCPLVFFNPDTKLMDTTNSKESVNDVTDLGDGRFLFHIHNTHQGPLSGKLVGQYAVLMYRGKGNAIRLLRSGNTTLQNITIHNAPATAIAITNCRGEIRITDSQIIPATGALLASSADGIHAMSNRGKLTIDHCRFLATGDDTLNNYALYHAICTAEANSFIADRLFFQNYQLGDNVVFMDFENNQQVSQAKVTGLIYTTWQDKPALRITVDRELSDLKTLQSIERPNFNGRLSTLKKPYPHFVINTSATGGQLTFENNELGNHVYRGLLIRSNHSVVRNNQFRDMLGPAIHAAPIWGWPEGHAVDGLLIHNNQFTHVNTTNIYVGLFDAQYHPVTQGNWHKQIDIQNNQFQLFGKPYSGWAHGQYGQVIYLGCTDHATITNNHFGSLSPDATEENQALIELQSTEHVTISNNQLDNPNAILLKKISKNPGDATTAN
jgi:hypothetical protein